MSWIKLASDLIREAMTTDAAPTGPPPQPTHSADITGLFAQHRAQVDRNLEILVSGLNKQNEELLHAVQIQKRWNYGLTVGLVVVAILAVFALAR